MSSGRLISKEECKEKKYELRRIEKYYRNYDLEQKAYERAQKGFEAFGRFFQNL